MKKQLLILLLPLLLSGCATKVQTVFTDGPVYTRIDDTQDIPEPEEQDFLRISHLIDNLVLRQARFDLNPTPPAPALDVNRFGQVLDSTWYTNRIATLNATDVGQGPGGSDPGPEAYKPWTITGLKIGGVNPGFVFQDSRGVGYICKFDKKDEPVVATAADPIASRLFWALGYNVPDDRVVYFQADDLKIKPGAKVKNALGHKRPLDRDDIDVMLEWVPCRLDNGDYRAMVSRFLSGVTLGGYAYSGTREDDANDTIEHQQRRSLRGLRVFGAWLGHVDQKIDNSLDLYVTENGRSFIRHYLVDFDACLGGFWSARHEQRIGFRYDFDLNEFITGIPQLGLVVRPYEDIGEPEHPQVGVFESHYFQPSIWRPNYVNDYFAACGRADAYWAGTVLLQITDEMIDQAVANGRYPDPEAAVIAARVLRERRLKTLNWALQQVSPVCGLDQLTQTADALDIAAVDLMNQADLDASLSWCADLLDKNREVLETLKTDAEHPEVRIDSKHLTGHDYLIVRWIAEDQYDKSLPPTEAHYIRGAEGWQLAGILRDNE
jgi:hypothetical protein